jgi:hypothetical protein
MARHRSLTQVRWRMRAGLLCFALVAVSLAGCGGSRVVREDPPPPVSSGGTTTGVVVVEVGAVGGPVAQPSPPARSDRPLQVQWSNVTSSSGCFFFSGPESLGRDDHLGAVASYASDGRTARLVFDGRVIFEGFLGTQPFTLVRTSVHQYSGTWSVRETFALDPLGQGAFRGRYHYDELDPSGNPTGSCNIDALVMLVPY